MNITRDDAASALQDVDSAQRRSVALFEYELASPFLVLWGGLWIVAGAVGAASPGNAGFGWLVVDIIGLVGTGILIVRQSRRYPDAGERVPMVRYAATVAVVAAFLTATLTVVAPVTGVQVLMVITLLVAAIYMTAGIWCGRRYAVVGAALGALALGLFHLAPAHVPLLVPFLGGGGLILGGLWMRRS